MPVASGRLPGNRATPHGGGTPALAEAAQDAEQQAFNSRSSAVLLQLALPPLNAALQAAAASLSTRRRALEAARRSLELDLAKDVLVAAGKRAGRGACGPRTKETIHAHITAFKTTAPLNSPVERELVVADLDGVPAVLGEQHAVTRL